MRKVVLCLTLLGLQAAALASEEDALAIADSATSNVVAPSDWRGFVEYGVVGSQRRDRSYGPVNHRLSVDVALDTRVGEGLRFILADRLDLNSELPALGRQYVNTLKEAYFSWKTTDRLLIDAGRVNLRYGVGIGYNPTDIFRDRSVRSWISVDPVTTRANRMGSAMVRSQWLWDGGSVTGLVSPKLESERNRATFNPDWGATNGSTRWLMALSHKLSDDFNPQFLLYQDGRSPVQAGLNLSMLAGNAAVVYMEWAGGKSADVFAQATGQTGMERWRHHASSGVTWTATSKLTVSGEYQYNGSALAREDWARLGAYPAPYALYRARMQQLQSPFTRHSVFVSARWQDVPFERTDLVALSRYSRDDKSFMWWLELVTHFDTRDLALQLQRQQGRSTSEFGGLPDQWVGQALIRQHF